MEEIMITASSMSAKIKKPSKPLRDMISVGAITGSVLDFGCGKGSDMVHMHYIDAITSVNGYDPNFLPHIVPGPYDTIFCSYVINYIKDQRDINDMLHIIDNNLKVGGKFILIARSIGEVKGNVNRNTNWTPCNNGYISKDDMFQRGYDTFELNEIIKGMGYCNISNKYPIPPVAYTFVIGLKEK